MFVIVEKLLCLKIQKHGDDWRLTGAIDFHHK